jgi:hypothetical protein
VVSGGPLQPLDDAIETGFPVLAQRRGEPGDFAFGGAELSNTIQAIDIEVAQIWLTINSPYADRNTFGSPYFNCPTPIVATVGQQQFAGEPELWRRRRWAGWPVSSACLEKIRA